MRELRAERLRRPALRIGHIASRGSLAPIASIKSPEQRSAAGYLCFVTLITTRERVPLEYSCGEDKVENSATSRALGKLADELLLQPEGRRQH